MAFEMLQGRVPLLLEESTLFANLWIQMKEETSNHLKLALDASTSMVLYSLQTLSW